MCRLCSLYCGGMLGLGWSGRAMGQQWAVLFIGRPFSGLGSPLAGARRRLGWKWSVHGKVWAGHGLDM